MKHSTITSFFIFCFLLLAPTAQTFAQWQWLSPGYTNAGNYNQTNLGVAVDPNGGVYTTGTYYDKTNSDYKIMLRKFAADGKLMYFKLHNTATGNDNLETGNDIGVSLASNVVAIGGQRHGGAPFLGFFDAGNGNFFSYSPNISGDGSIQKIDVVGSSVWVIGNFGASVTLAGSTTYTGNGLPFGNIFIAKYSLTNGALLSSCFIQSNYLKAYDIKVDNGNNVYFTARAYSTVNFVTSNSTYNPAPPMEAFLAKLSPSYAVAWVKAMAPSHTSYNLDERYPIALVPGDEWSVVVGGYSAAVGGGVIQRRYIGNGTLASQVANIPGKSIFDLGVANCNPQSLYVAGGTNSKLYLDKYNLSNNLSYVSGQVSSTNALGTALAMDGANKPVVTGNYDNGVYTINGQSINVANQKGAVTGLYNDPGTCCTNRGIIMDGINDYVSANYMPLSGNTNFTFEAWVYSISTGTGNFRRLLGWGSSTGHQIELGETGGLLTVKYYNPGLQVHLLQNVNLRNGWHHVALTRNGSALTLYADGFVVGTGTVTGINIPSNGYFNIGQKAAATGSNTENWKGRVDEVRLWNYARTANSILTKKDCSLRGNEPGLALYYSLDHGIPNGQNAGATIAWNSAPSVTLYGKLNNFTLSGSLSNWCCTSLSGLTMNGICSPFAPDEGADDRAEASVGETEEPASATGFQIFPNPNSGRFHLKLTQPAPAEMSFQIANITGKVLRVQTAAPDNPNQEIEIMDLPAGMYLLQVVGDGKVLGIEKFVKQ